jgi:hypothetical protein
MGKKKGMKGKKLDLSEFLADKPVGSVADKALPTVSRSRQVVDIDMYVSLVHYGAAAHVPCRKWGRKGEREREKKESE